MHVDLKVDYVGSLVSPIFVPPGLIFVICGCFTYEESN